MEAFIDEDCAIDSEDEGAQASRGMEYCCNFEEYPYESKISHDLVNNRCYWSGNMLMDYMFHVANSHPLFSIFVSHPAHPYSKFERFAVLIIVSALTLFPSAAFIAVWTKVFEEPVDSTTGIPTAAGTVPSIDPGQEIMSFFSTKAGLFLLVFVTLPVMVLQVVLTKMVILDIYFRDHTHHDQIGFCCSCMVTVIRLVKTCCICGSCCLAIVMIFVSITFLRMNDASEEIEGVDPWISSTMLPVFPWAISRLQSWVLWFPLDAFMPCCGFIWKFLSEGSSARSVRGGVAREMDSVDDYY